MNKSRKLKLDKNYMPIPTNVGDEIYPNGIFDFNISKMLEHITARKLDAKKELINVSEWFIKAVSHIVRQVNRVTIYKEPQYRIEWSENQVDFEEEYRNYRRRQVGLHKIILKEFVSANDYLKAAALLGILNTNNEVVIESKSEEDALYDFNIYGGGYPLSSTCVIM